MLLRELFGRIGSIASILVCPRHVRLGGNLCRCQVFSVEATGLEVIQAPKPQPRIMRYELTDAEWAAVRILKRANRIMGCTRETAQRLARRTPHAERACPAEYRRSAYRKSSRVLPSRHAIAATSDPHRPSAWGSPPVAPEPENCSRVSIGSSPRVTPASATVIRRGKTQIPV